VSERSREALWVLRAQSGDAEALALLLRSVQPQLLRFIRALVHPSDAEDVLQETLMRIYKKLGQLAAPELFRAWAFRIAKREALRHAHHSRRRLGEMLSAPALNDIPTTEVSVTGESLEELFRRGQVSPASRAVLVLHFQDGLSLPEIAGVLELPLGTVKSRLGYGLAVLRKNLGGTGRDR
jgi:RNA polymerase sigma-70 factor (ECF subfamily)